MVLFALCSHVYTLESRWWGKFWFSISGHNISVHGGNLIGSCHRYETEEPDLTVWGEAWSTHLRNGSPCIFLLCLPMSDWLSLLADIIYHYSTHSVLFLLKTCLLIIFKSQHLWSQAPSFEQLNPSVNQLLSRAVSRWIRYALEV